MRRLILEEPFAQSAIWSWRLAVFAVASAVLALILSRTGAADPFAALTIFGGALAIAGFAALLAIAAMSIIWRTGRRGAGRASLALALCLALLAYPAWLTVVAFILPPINDVTTDLESPPSFMISAKARAARRGRMPAAPSQATLEAQRAAYPDLQPAVVDLEAAQAYQLALRLAGELGWRVVDANPPNLRGDGVAHIEAIDRSLLFGFVDDIAIRIRPLATQTRIDVRSVSRFGRHDFGANARRVAKFVAAVQSAMKER